MEAFGAAQQAAFKAGLAAVLDGVVPAEIDLRIRSASLLLEVLIRTASAQASSSAATTVRTLGPVGLSGAVGMVVAGLGPVEEQAHTAGDQKGSLGSLTASEGAAAGVTPIVLGLVGGSIGLCAVCSLWFLVRRPRALSRARPGPIPVQTAPVQTSTSQVELVMKVDEYIPTID